MSREEAHEKEAALVFMPRQPIVSTPPSKESRSENHAKFDSSHDVHRSMIEVEEYSKP